MCNIFLSKKRVLDNCITSGNDLCTTINHTFVTKKPPSDPEINDSETRAIFWVNASCKAMEKVWFPKRMIDEFSNSRSSSPNYREGNIKLQNILKDIEAKVSLLKQFEMQVGQEKQWYEKPVGLIAIGVIIGLIIPYALQFIDWLVTHLPSTSS